MYLTCHLLWALSLGSFVSATAKLKVGCRLEVPKHVGVEKEPNIGSGQPLEISVDMKVLGVRDVPESGGSYEMDVM